MQRPTATTPRARGTRGNAAAAREIVAGVPKRHLNRAGHQTVAVTKLGDQYLVADIVRRKNQFKISVLAGKVASAETSIAFSLDEVPYLADGLSVALGVLEPGAQDSKFVDVDIDMLNRVADMIRDSYKDLIDALQTYDQTGGGGAYLDRLRDKLAATQAKVEGLIRGQANQIHGGLLKSIFDALYEVCRNGDWRVKDDDGDGIINVHDSDYDGPRDKTWELFESLGLGNGPFIIRLASRWEVTDRAFPTVLLSDRPSRSMVDTGALRYRL